MMKYFITTSIIALVLFPVAFAQNMNQLSTPVITVSGSSEIKVTPDKAVITVSIETIDKDVAVSKKQNDDIVKKVIDSCVKSGIAESDISTDFINIDSRYQRDYEQKKFLGFYMSRRVAITLKDISKFDNLISDLLTSGIDGIQNVDFQTSELRKYKDQARAEAVLAAREKALAMAKELGNTIGKAISIEERSSNYQPWYSNWYGGRNYPNPFNATSVAPAPPMGQADSDMPLALGKISVSASVSVSFELQ
jgi:uncharacterized protein